MRKAGLIVLLLFFTSTAIQNCVATSPLPSIQEEVNTLYNTCGLSEKLSFQAFSKTISGYQSFHPAKPIVAICDFSKPSTESRFFVVDVNSKKLLYESLVAHGKNSGELMATRFSNKPESHQSSLGFYSIGQAIQSPKHGLALLLNGLQKGLNDNALKREIIIHGADYVSQKFIDENGRLGRSFGCPALPNEVMKEVAPILKDGALLYIYAG